MRQIIAMGGGGFSMEEENPLLDQYILRQARKSRPKVCFVPQRPVMQKDILSNFIGALRSLIAKPLIFLYLSRR